MFQKMPVVDGITERYGPCAVNATKTNDGLRNAIKLQVFSFIYLIFIRLCRFHN